MAQRNAAVDTKTRVTVQVSDKTKSELNEIAYSLSEPGDNVTASELVREAITDYVEKFNADPQECDPRDRGCIGGVEIDVEEGAA